LAAAKNDGVMYSAAAGIEKLHNDKWGKRMIDFAPELEAK